MIKLYAYPNTSASAESQSECAYKLLLRALECDFGICASVSDISKAELGKPYFAHGDATDIFFSLSHTKGLAVCGISDNDIGVDIERSDREISERIRKRWLRDCNAEASILEWTALESKGKLIGCGVSSSILNESDISVKHYTINANGVEYTVALASRLALEEFPDSVDVIL